MILHYNSKAMTTDVLLFWKNVQPIVVDLFRIIISKATSKMLWLAYITNIMLEHTVASSFKIFQFAAMSIVSVHITQFVITRTYSFFWNETLSFQTYRFYATWIHYTRFFMYYNSKSLSCSCSSASKRRMNDVARTNHHIYKYI